MRTNTHDGLLPFCFVLQVKCVWAHYLHNPMWMGTHDMLLPFFFKSKLLWITKWPYPLFLGNLFLFWINLDGRRCLPSSTSIFFFFFFFFWQQAILIGPSQIKYWNFGGSQKYSFYSQDRNPDCLFFLFTHLSR